MVRNRSQTFPKLKLLLIMTYLVLTEFVKRLESTSDQVWSYSGSKGPDRWQLDYPFCGGMKQSPIDIVTSNVIVDTTNLRPLTFQNYDVLPYFTLQLSNTGHSVEVDLPDGFYSVSSGGLPGRFVANQLHFHWGREDGRGSEHALNGRFFDMEMHIVHYNSKYGNFSNAVDKETDGLAVLGFFFKVGEINENFDQIISHFYRVHFKDEHVTIAPFILSQLLPEDLELFYRYEGSLTTPPCYESVQWTLFSQPIEISEEQLQQFRTSLYENENTNDNVFDDMVDDYRPIQNMYRRSVYASSDSLKFLDATSGTCTLVSISSTTAVINFFVFFTSTGS